MARRHSRAAGIICLLAACSGLGACSAPTPYRPYVGASRAAGGYSETKLADARYRVTFSGNSLTSRERVETYLLYRAAELAARDGYDWFLIVDRHTEHDVQTWVETPPSAVGAYPNWRPGWRYRRPGLAWQSWPNAFGSIDVRTVESFEANAEIVLHRGPMPAGEERAFDARQVMARLESMIERPRPERRPRGH